jgi:outer membrane protein
MKKIIGLAVLVGTELGAAPSVQAADGPWLVRLRALSFQADSSTNPAANIEVKDKVFPEVDITYFFTRNIAAELILTYPQKLDVTAGGNNIGSVKALPPTLTVQYHFMPDATFRPYVGAGVNITLFSSVDLLGGGADIDSSSIGPALQVGADVKLAKQWYLNFDVKKVYMKTDVTNTANGSKITTLTIDPLLLSAGVGYRF